MGRGLPGEPPQVPGAHPTRQAQTFGKHVAHVQHGHEVVDVAVDALGHAGVLRGRGERGADTAGPPGAQQPPSSVPPRPRPPWGPEEPLKPLGPRPPVLRPHLPQPLPRKAPPLQLSPRQTSLFPPPRPHQTCWEPDPLPQSAISKCFSAPSADQALGTQVRRCRPCRGPGAHAGGLPGSSWPPRGRPSCEPGAPARWRRRQRAAPQSTPACPASWGPGLC